MALGFETNGRVSRIGTNCDFAEQVEDVQRKRAVEIVLDWKFPTNNRELLDFTNCAISFGSMCGMHALGNWLDAHPDQLAAWSEAANETTPPPCECATVEKEFGITARLEDLIKLPNMTFAQLSRMLKMTKEDVAAKLDRMRVSRTGGLI